MKFANAQCCFFGAATGSLLLLGLLVLLTGTSQPALADPSDLFASPGGGGTTCSQASPCGLQTAIGQTVDDDVVYLAGGTYTGAGGAVVTITEDIELLGGWDGAPNGVIVRDPGTYATVLDGQWQRRAVYVDGGANPTLDGLHLAYGWSAAQGGGLHAAVGSHTTLVDCEVYSNTATTHGGGTYFRGNATLTGNRIHDNVAQGNGGGMILTINAGTIVSGNQIHDNRAYWGGGIQTYQTDATLTNNDIYSNTAQESGGGANINEADGNRVTLAGNRFYSNTAFYGGGLIAGNCPVTLTGNLIHDNSADQGGGLYFVSSDAVLVNNIVVDNVATTGNGAAGIMVSGSDVRMLHTTLARNTGGRAGGVLVFDFYAETSTVTMTNTILVSHTVGIRVAAGHTATLEATLWGDGVWANGLDWSGTVTTGSVNVWGDPFFRSPDTGDYHIFARSAGVDMGAAAGVTTDIDGEPRPAPAGTGPDLGADEISQHLAHLPLVLRND